MIIVSEKRKMKIKTNKARNKSFKITMIYFIFGCIWIIVTDELAKYLTINPSDVFMFNIIKGLFYVAITAFFVYKLTYSVLKKLIDSEESLIESEQLFRTIYEQSPIGIAISKNGEAGTSTGNTLISMNPKFEQITGRTQADLIDLGWAQITHHEDLMDDLNYFRKLQAGEITTYSMDKRLIQPDSSIVWVNMVVARLNDTNSHICLVQDITERRTIESALFESERSKSVLLSHLPGLAYRCNYDCNYTMQYVSDGCFALTGYQSDHLIQNKVLSFNDIIAPEYRVPLSNKWEHILPKKLPLSYEYELITATGQRKWVLELGQGIFDSRGKVEALEGIIVDINDRKKYEMTLKHLSEHDSWTGLYNRTYFESLLSYDFKMRAHEKKAIIIVNLSAIHLLNLTYGFQYSQALIKRIATALLEHCNNNCQLFNICQSFRVLSKRISR